MSGDADVAKWKVLIVDDDVNNLDVATEFLEYLGATVRIAHDGQAGMEVLKDFTPTVILADLSMPHMDGWQLLIELRGKPETAAIPVIALTAHAMSADRDRVAAAGFDGYITKPFLLNGLVADVKRFLDKAGQPGENT